MSDENEASRSFSGGSGSVVVARERSNPPKMSTKARFRGGGGNHGKVKPPRTSLHARFRGLWAVVESGKSKTT